MISRLVEVAWIIRETQVSLASDQRRPARGQWATMPKAQPRPVLVHLMYFDVLLVSALYFIFIMSSPVGKLLTASAKIWHQHNW